MTDPRTNAPADTPFSLACHGCDAGMDVTSYEQAVLSGWTGIEYDDGLAWNFLRTCPECRREEEFEEAARKLRRKS